MIVFTSEFAGGITPSQVNLAGDATAKEGEEISDFSELLTASLAVAQRPTVTDVLGDAGASESDQADDRAPMENSAEGIDPSANTSTLLVSVLTLAPAAPQQNIPKAASADRQRSTVTGILTQAVGWETGPGGAEKVADPGLGASGIYNREISPSPAAQGSNRTEELATINQSMVAAENTHSLEGNGFTPSAEALPIKDRATSPIGNSSATADSQRATLADSKSHKEIPQGITSDPPVELPVAQAVAGSVSNVKENIFSTTGSSDSRRQVYPAQKPKGIEQPSPIEAAIKDGLGKLHFAPAELGVHSKRDANLLGDGAVLVFGGDSITIDDETHPLRGFADSQSSFSGHHADQFSNQSGLKFGDHGVDLQSPSSPYPAQNFLEVAAPLSHRLETATNEHSPGAPWSPVLHQVAHEIASSVRIGKQEAIIQLDPPELGKIKINLRVDGDRIEARIITEENSAKVLIEKHLPELRQALEAGRVDLADVRVDQQSGASANSQGNQGFHDAPQYRRQQASGHAIAASEFLTDTAPAENSQRTARDKGRVSMWA